MKTIEEFAQSQIERSSPVWLDPEHRGPFTEFAIESLTYSPGDEDVTIRFGGYEYFAQVVEKEGIIGTTRRGLCHGKHPGYGYQFAVGICVEVGSMNRMEPPDADVLEVGTFDNLDDAIIAAQVHALRDQMEGFAQAQSLAKIHAEENNPEIW